MRVGLLIYGDLNTRSGGYLYDRMLVEHLTRQGDQVVVISLSWRGYLRQWVDNLSAWLRRRLESLQVSVLLQDELNHPSLFLLNNRLQQTVNYPIVSIVHHLRSCEAHPVPLTALYRHVERRYLATVAGFIFNSHTTKGEVERLVGARPGVVAYPGGDHLDVMLSPAQIESRARAPGPLRVVFVGNVIPRKGLDVLIAALRKLPRTDWQLTVIGRLDVERAYTSRVLAQVHEARLNGQIRFCGEVSNAQLRSLLEQQHVLAVPSFYEGFGIVYLEAKAFGLPAIACAAGAAHEIVTPDQDGYLVPPGEPGVLASVLGNLHRDRGQLIKMSLAAQDRFARHPTWDNAGAQIRSFLQNVILS